MRPNAIAPEVARTEATRAEAARAERGGGFTPVPILIVDDHPENLLALEAVLEPLGQHLVRAGSGEEALRRLLARDFALILLDVQMPGMNGFETAQLIKARERSRDIPIIFLTAISKEEVYVVRGYEAGAVDYVFKPFNPDVLRSKVAVFVELHHRREQLARQERALRDAERRELDLEHRARLLAHEAESAARLERVNAQLEATNATLAARQEELERALDVRSRFYTSMSHELRTPLNAIIGYSTLLLDGIYGPLEEQQARGIERTHRAAQHLLELVNDILDLSKIEAGKFELSLQPTAVRALVDDLSVTVQPMADAAGSPLAVRHEGAGSAIETDPRRVRQILLNLLSNAIKFGAGAPIEVVSRALPDGGVEVAVRDHGSGIPAEDLPRVFDEFVQLEHSRGRAVSTGTGLGLPISRRLAQILGGTLVAESVPGDGSTFRLTLPARVPDAGVPTPGLAPRA